MFSLGWGGGVGAGVGTDVDAWAANSFSVCVKIFINKLSSLSSIWSSCMFVKLLRSLGSASGIFMSKVAVSGATASVF